MVFHSRDLEINPVGYGFISNCVLNTKGVDAVNIQIQYKIFICVEGGISDPILEAG